MIATLRDAVTHLEPEGIDIHLTDSTDPETPQFLCFKPSRTREGRPIVEADLRRYPPGGLRSTTTLNMSGRRWTVVCTPTPDFLASRTTWLPWAGLAGGLMLTAMLTFYLAGTARHVARSRRLMEQAVAANQKLLAEIAERRRAEEALRVSQGRFSQVAENSGEWIWEVDAEGLYTYSSPAVEAILGYKPEEIVGKKHFFDFFAPADRDDLLKEAGQTLAQKRAFKSWINRNVHRTGNSVWLETSGAPVLDEGGSVVGYRGVDVDVTKRRRDEEALRESHEFLNKIINCIRDPIFVMDEQDRFVLVNDAVVAIHGGTREEALGKTTHDKMPAELADGYLRINQEVLATGVDSVTEEPCLDAQGRPSTVMTTKTRYVSPDGRRYVVAILRDVTESKRAEETLRESREFLNKIINTVRDPIFVQNDRHRFILANDAMCAFTGEPREGLLGRTVRDLLLPEEAEVIWKVDEEVFLTGEDHTNEERVTIPPRPPTVNLTKKSLYVDPAGTRFMVGVIRDITESKRAEEALRESQERFAQVAESAGELIWEIDPEGLLTYCNPAFESKLGYKVEEIVGRMRCFDFFAPDVREEQIGQVRGFLARTEPMRGLVTKNVRRDGAVVYHETTALPVLDERGSLLCYRGVNVDITDRKRSEEDLRDSRDFLNKILNTVRDPIVVENEQSRYVVANDAFCEMIGMPTERVIAKTVHEVLDPESAKEVAARNATFLAEGRDVIFEEVVTDRHDVRRTLQTSKSVYFDPSGKRFLVSIVRNVTEQKRLKEELRQSHDQLEQRVRERTAELVAANQQLRRAQTDLVQGEKMSMLGLLAAGVAHEINTPTGAILNVVADTYGHLKQLVVLGAACAVLTDEARNWAVGMLDTLMDGAAVRSEPAARAERRRVEARLRQSGVAEPRRIAEVVVACGLAEKMDERTLGYLTGEPVLSTIEHVLAMKAATDITQSSAKKIARIVRALRSYSRDEIASPGRLDVNESIDNTLVILQHRLKHIQDVGIHLAEGLPPAACGPELAQVWTNLLNNACDAIELSGHERPDRIEVSTRPRGGRIIVAVSNSGPPIPEDAMRKMYDPFFTTKPVGKGTGLGLSICTGILERYGGSLSARNEEDRVTFEVSIPASEAREGPPAPAHPVPSLETARLPGEGT